MKLNYFRMLVNIFSRQENIPSFCKRLTLANMNEMYKNGSYLSKNSTWHIEDSSWKAEQIQRMIKDNKLLPQNICEVGCGAGCVLRNLQAMLDSKCNFFGYDISPQAYELSRSMQNERLSFFQKDILDEIWTCKEFCVNGFHFQFSICWHSVAE